MSANISSLFICPRCNEASSSKNKPESCPKCSYKFRKAGEELAQKFEWPKQLPDQLFELVQQDTEKYLDKSAKEILKSDNIPENLELHRQTKAALIKKKREKEMNEFLMSANVKDIEQLVLTLHSVMKLAVPSGNVELVHKLIIWGNIIADLTEGLETYIKKGGEVYERRKTKAGDSEGNKTDN